MNSKEIAGKCQCRFFDYIIIRYTLDTSLFSVSERSTFMEVRDIWEL